MGRSRARSDQQRMELLHYVRRHQVTSVRALAKALGRDYTNVHADVQAADGRRTSRRHRRRRAGRLRCDRNKDCDLRPGDAEGWPIFEEIFGTNRGGDPNPSRVDRFHETDRSGEFPVPTDKIPASSRAGNAMITAVRPPHCSAILAERKHP